MTGIAFFVVGVAKAKVVDQRWVRSGLETLTVGGLAATLAYVFGAILSGVSRYGVMAIAGKPEMSQRPSIADLEERLARPAHPGRFTDDEVKDLPEPVQRYFRAAIAPGTSLAVAARVRSRGKIKIKGWLPFRSHQLEAPTEGFVWAARVAGLISGYDFYADGGAAMRWKALGVVTLVDDESPNQAKSAAGRAGAESIWVPTAMLPRFGVEWSAKDETHITSRHLVGDVEVRIHYSLDDDAHIKSLTFDRWGDPDGSGKFRLVPSGGDVSDYGTFDGVTVPTAGSYGWFHGTDRWAEGEFFRYEITDLKLVV